MLRHKLSSFTHSTRSWSSHQSSLLLRDTKKALTDGLQHCSRVFLWAPGTSKAQLAWGRATDTSNKPFRFFVLFPWSLTLVVDSQAWEIPAQLIGSGFTFSRWRLNYGDDKWSHPQTWARKYFTFLYVSVLKWFNTLTGIFYVVCKVNNDHKNLSSSF